MVNDFEPVGPSGNIATGNLLATYIKCETCLPTLQPFINFVTLWIIELQWLNLWLFLVFTMSM